MSRSSRNIMRQQVVAESQLIWVSHEDKVVFFNKRKGFQKMMFLDKDALMNFVKNCVEEGYKIG